MSKGSVSAQNAAALEAAKSKALIETPAPKSSRKSPDRKQPGRRKNSPSRELETV
jgi:hypothetical protein